jgi:hypothetical protein
VGGLVIAMGPAAHVVHNTLGDALAVKAREQADEVEVLQQVEGRSRQLVPKYLQTGGLPAAHLGFNGFQSINARPSLSSRR